MDQRRGRRILIATFEHHRGFQLSNEKININSGKKNPLTIHSLPVQETRSKLGRREKTLLQRGRTIQGEKKTNRSRQQQNKEKKKRRAG